ncbi:MAG: hypothetical protein L3J44_05690 [Campylobacteraceae bacterium]|nr:hypothetical protein [Campylobacteraceae bacterium]
MELKEVIMSTLAELESVEEAQETQLVDKKSSLSDKSASIMEADSVISSEKQFYENIRERILVLFEGFQSPNNKNIEAKVDLTLNFLEYLLATIDERLESLNTSNK